MAEKDNSHSTRYSLDDQFDHEEDEKRKDEEGSETREQVM